MSALTLVRPSWPRRAGHRAQRAAKASDALRRHRSGPAFIILSAYWDPTYHVRAVELGAKGYLSRMATIEQIRSAIETGATGGTAFPAAARSFALPRARAGSTRIARA